MWPTLGGGVVAAEHERELPGRTPSRLEDVLIAEDVAFVVEEGPPAVVVAGVASASDSPHRGRRPPARQRARRQASFHRLLGSVKLGVTRAGALLAVRAHEEDPVRGARIARVRVHGRRAGGRTQRRTAHSRAMCRARLAAARDVGELPCPAAARIDNANRPCAMRTPAHERDLAVPARKRRLGGGHGGEPRRRDHQSSKGPSRKSRGALNRCPLPDHIAAGTAIIAPCGRVASVAMTGGWTGTQPPPWEVEMAQKKTSKAKAADVKRDN